MFKSSLDVTGDQCDKCRKPMNPEAPGVYIYASCKEAPRQVIMLHIDCMQKVVRDAEKEAVVTL